MEQIAEEGINFQLFCVTVTRQIYICLGYLFVTEDHALRQL